MRQHEEIDFDLIFRRKDGIQAPSDALAATVPPLPCQKRLGQVQAWHDQSQKNRYCQTSQTLVKIDFRWSLPQRSEFLRSEFIACD